MLKVQTAAETILITSFILIIFKAKMQKIC